MPATTLLDGMELPQAQCVDVEEEHALERHAVPALEGDFHQRLGRRAARVSLRGVAVGAVAREGLGALREKFRAAEPVDFVADVAVATRVGRVLIEELEVRELAGRPERFEYAFALREWLPPPRPETEEPPPRPRPPPPTRETGTLAVEVVVEGEPEFDMSRVTVTADLRTEEGGTSTRVLADRADNVWTAEEVAPGEVTARAEAAADGLAGAAAGTVAAGQTARLRIVLQRRQAVANAFVVHFRFDSAFVEPCMRAVLARAVAFGNSSAHAADRLLVVGHTDKTGSGAYNQSLSERRARAVWAFLAFGRDPEGAVREWTALRQPRPPGAGPTLADRWDVREYQQMLQDLGWYAGTIDGDRGGPGSQTNEAIRAFRCHRGLLPGTMTDDPFWDALIRDYLGQDRFAWPEARLLPNCPDEPLRWLGCGEEDPVLNTERPHRPNRRVELLFVRDAALPCPVPRPDTFELPPPDGAGTAWCLGGPPAGAGHACFLARGAPQPGRWQVVPAEPDTVSVRGRISREVRQADGSVTLAPVPGRSFVAVTPVGEFRRGERHDEVGRGEPVPDRTAAPPPPDRSGTFGYDGVPEGTWTLQVVAEPRTQAVLARLEEDADAPVEGAVLCKRLHRGDQALNVVIVAAPAVREIRLPVAVHLMTALHPATRAVRTCPTGPAGAPHEQRSALTDQEVRDAFAGANRIWQQGRVRFEVVDVVREAYAFRTECEVDHSEFVILMQRCSYPGVVNVFFVGDLEGSGEAGFGLSPESAAAQGIPGIGGCALGDRFQGLGITFTMDAAQREQVLAHELGHYLDLHHPDDVPANANRLMYPSTTLLARNRRLEPAEVDHARASEAARDDCTPLRLRVAGAARVGGTLSHRFVYVRDPASPPAVTVDAEIPAEMLDPARGTLAMDGGAPGAGPLQRVVPTGATGTVELTATYTPVGGTPVVRRVFVHVVDFELRVEGRNPTPPGGNVFVLRRQPGSSAVVVAELSSTPFCVPLDLVAWQGGDAVDDPLRRRVGLDGPREVTVRATVAGVARSVVFRVFDAAFTSVNDPFGPALTRVQTEGLLNASLASVDRADLIGAQRDSLFHLRADVPGQPAAVATLAATLQVTAPGGGAVESLAVTLRRTPSTGDTFLSLPILAVSATIGRAEITLRSPADMLVVRARAGGAARFAVQGVLSGLATAQAQVRGRVSSLFVQAFDTSGTSVADARRQMRLADRLWAQAGIEVRERSVADGVTAPAGLDDLDFAIPFAGTLTTKERRFLNLLPGGPARSAVPNDMNVYYVRRINGPPAGVAYSGESYPGLIADPANTAIALEGPSVTDAALAHELGHHFLRGWGGDEHRDHSAPPVNWPPANVMHPADTGTATTLDPEQVRNILAATAGGAHPCIVFVP